MEACLDTQYLTLLAPNAEVHVVFANSALMSDLRAAIVYVNSTVKPDIVSMSWGIDEDTIGRYQLNSLFRRPICSGHHLGGIIRR